MGILIEKTKLITKKIKVINNNRKLLNKDFTIISDNCWGNFMYQEVNVKYNSPFIGLFIYAPDYIKLLQNLKYYIGQDLTFIKHSKYEEFMPKKEIIGAYPLALLGGEIEIHFLHYKNEQEVLEKWHRRVKRINWNNLYVKMSERPLCTKELIELFDALDYDKKVCFTKNEYLEYKSCVWLKEMKDMPYVQDEWVHQKKYFNIVDWLNH